MTARTWPHVAQGSGGRTYDITPVTGAGDDGPFFCTCPAWKFSKETPKACKHIHAMTGGARPATTATVAASAAAAAPARAADGTTLPRPMKLETATVDALAAIVALPEWVMEQKVDGTRCTITVRPGEPALFGNGSGGPLRHSTSAAHFDRVRAALADGFDGAHYVLDAEMLWTGDVWVFDLLEVGDDDLRGQTFAERRAMLEEMFDLLDFDGRVVRLLPQATTVDEKQALLRTVHDRGGEGVVLKNVGGRYHEGARVREQVKVKFVKTVDAVVTARNTRGKCNAELAVHRDGALVSIGSCSMNGKPDAQVGDVVEVAYLYATEDLTIYQPSLQRIRTDKPAADCSIDQLRPVDKSVLEAVTA